MATKIDINANIESENKTGITGEKSLKSLRTYQLGVVYKDEYGRETPVFTNEDASFTIPKAFSNTKNSITAKVKNLAPDWSDSYKLFIKEITCNILYHYSPSLIGMSSLFGLHPQFFMNSFILGSFIAAS